MPRWLMNALVEAATPEGYRAVVTSDAPCHLWLRWSRNKPQRHPRVKVVRGLRLMGDVYYCFTAYNDIEQEEAGDTTEHTFIMSDWPACETRWFYLWGTIGGEATPSESPIWGRHLYYTPSSVVVYTIALVDQCARYGGAWFTFPPAGPMLIAAGRWQTQAQKVGSGMRFQNVLIPQYAEITDAKIWFTCHTTYIKMIINTRIRCENVGNAPDFTGITYPQFLIRRANGTSFVNWDAIPYWYINQAYASREFNTPLQEVVGRSDWESGNSLVVIWDDFDQRSTWSSLNHRRAWSYRSDPTKAPELHVAFNEWLLEGVNP